MEELYVMWIISPKKKRLFYFKNEDTKELHPFPLILFSSLSSLFLS